MRLDIVFLVGRSTSAGRCWDVCGLLMILGSLCVNGWGCIPVLLVVWHRVSSSVACWSLSGAGSWRWDADLLEIFTIWYYVEQGGLFWTRVLNLALPLQTHSLEACLEHQESVIHTAQNKREKKKKETKEREDGRRVRRGDHLPPHRYIRNTATRGTAHIEHPLNADRRRQTSQKARNSPHTWVGQKKKEITETKV